MIETSTELAHLKVLIKKKFKEIKAFHDKIATS